MHFALLCPPLPGHINPALALADELLARGHRVTALTTEDFADSVRKSGVELVIVGRERHPAGSLRALNQALAREKGIGGGMLWHRDHARYMTILLDEGPALLAQLRPDALLVDEVEAAGQALAEHLDLPFVTLCNALPLMEDPAHPPVFTALPPARTWPRRGFYRLFRAISDRLVWSTFADLRRRRAEWRLPRLRGRQLYFARSRRLILSQLPAALDFPRLRPSALLRHTRSWRVTARPSLTPELQALVARPGPPFVYASLGSLQGDRRSLFHLIAEACAPLPLRLIIAHGGGLSAQEAAALPGAPVALAWAPQEALLDHCAAVITHGGLNTVLDAAERGLPCVTVPLAFEQPAIAARLAHHRTGLVLPVEKISAEGLRAAVHRAVTDGELRTRAAALAAAIPAAPGVALAADALEKALQLVKTEPAPIQR